MKSKLALILGLVCIAISAVTLFSALSHANQGESTLTFLNIDGVSSSIQGVSVLEKNPRFLKLDVSPLKFPKAEISLVLVEFGSEYDAALARELLSKQRMDLSTSYVKVPAGTKYTARTVSFVDAEGQYVVNQIPKAAIVYADEMMIGVGGSLTTLQSVVADEVRSKQLNEGVYVGAYGKIMWTWDGFRCQGKINENNLCHKNIPPAQR